MAMVNAAPTVENLRPRGCFALAFTAPDSITDPCQRSNADSKFRVSLFLAAAELELVLFHIHFAAPEAHAFAFQPQPLFDGRIAAQLDFSARA